MYQHILVPIDGSATAERGLQEAIRLAADLKARLHLLHVVDGAAYPLFVDLTPASLLQETLDRLHEYGQGLLASARTAAGKQNVEADSTLVEVLQGMVADAIVETARRKACDLIVMGTHGRRGWQRLALGSDAEQVARTSPVPVLLVRLPEA